MGAEEELGAVSEVLKIAGVSLENANRASTWDISRVPQHEALFWLWHNAQQGRARLGMGRAQTSPGRARTQRSSDTMMGSPVLGACQSCQFLLPFTWPLLCPWQHGLCRLDA